MLDFDNKAVMTKLQELPENVITNNLVIPLLEELGFYRVEFYGGAIEKGKDILCWDKNKFEDITLTVVHVKHFKLTNRASDSRSLQTIINQLTCCFKDTIISTNQTLHKPIDAILITTHIVDTKMLETQFSNHPDLIEKRIKIIDGLKLSELIISKIPSIAKEIFGNAYLGSCFISHSSKDTEFAIQLYDRLQSRGINCWYAPKDLVIGDKIRDEIENAITKYEKLLIILSKNSVDSDWVEDEVEAAIEKEKIIKKGKLIPISIDSGIFDINKSWLNKIKRTRHIGDFSSWKDERKFSPAFESLVTALKK